MRPIVLYGIFVVILPGCGGESSYRAVVRDQAKAFEEMTEILKTMTDKESMAAARESLLERREEFEAIAQRGRSLSKPSRDMGERLKDDVGKLSQAWRNFQREVQRVRALPGGPEFLTDIGLDKDLR